MLDNLGQNEQINVCDITCCLIIALMVDCVVLENTVHQTETFSRLHSRGIDL